MQGLLFVAIAVCNTIMSRGISQVTPNIVQLMILINVCWSGCAKPDFSCDVKVDPGLGISFISHSHHSVVAKNKVYHFALLELSMANQQ